MKKETLEQQISGATESLLAIARESSWNSISDSCLYILSEINHKDCDLNFIERTKKRKKMNRKKIPKTLSEIVPVLDEWYSDLYEIDLYIYKATRSATIIEIQYLLKSTLDLESGTKLLADEPMLHCKVPVPQYAVDSKEKFDINWQLQTWKYYWKMFWWKREITKKMKEMKNNVG